MPISSSINATNDQWFYQLAENLPIGVYRTDKSGNCVYTNRAWQSLFETTLEKSLGTNAWLRSIHDGDRDSVLEHWQAAITSESSFAMEFRIKGVNGSIRSAFSNAVPVTMPDGNLTFIGIVVDISENAALKQTLLQHERTLALLMANLNGMAYRCVNDDQWTMQYVSDGCAKLTGYVVDELLENRVKSFGDLIHADDAEALLIKCQQNLEAKISCSNQYRITTREGTLKWVWDQAHGVYDDHGELIFIEGFITDISAQKEMEFQNINNQKMAMGLLEAAPDAIVVIDGQGNIVRVNKQVQSVFGYTTEELIGRSIERLLPEQYRDHHKTLREGYNQNPVVRKMQSKISLTALHAKGHIFPTEVSLSPFEHNGQQYVISVIRDITTRLNDEQSLRIAATVYEHSSEAMMVLSEDHYVLSVNNAFATITGYTKADVLGKIIPRQLFTVDEESEKNIWRSLDEREQWHGESWVLTNNLERIAISLTINKITRSLDDIGFVALFSDITTKKVSDEIIWRQANFDVLTNLPNRLLFHQNATTEIKKSQRNRSTFALLLIDLDNFKEVNDTLGHLAGDELLKQVANRLQHCVRDSDSLARLGGDEFILLLSSIQDIDDVVKISEQINHSLATPYQLGDELAFISASIGITIYPNDGEDINALLRYADQAMYAAKNGGRNRFHFFTPELQKNALNRRTLSNELRQAIIEEQFLLHLQPILDLKTGIINKAEALIRWQHPQRGLIYPAEFITLAEETGLIIPLGDWIFKWAVRYIKHIQQRCGKAIQLSINKSSVQFLNRSTKESENWLSFIRENNIPYDAVNIELTESLLLEKSDLVSHKIHMYRNYGVKICIDDFGTGYSSLAYINNFDFDYLKLDRSFISKVGSDHKSFALCEAIIAMAHKLKIKVVAEGIETAEQLSIMTDMGCDFGQGYFIARPMPATDFEKSLQSNPPLGKSK